MERGLGEAVDLEERREMRPGGGAQTHFIRQAIIEENRQPRCAEQSARCENNKWDTAATTNDLKFVCARSIPCRQEKGSPKAKDNHDAHCLPVSTSLVSRVRATCTMS